MSMSQEEIEALMNGLDISENEASSEPDTTEEEVNEVSDSQVEDLVSQDISSSVSENEDIELNETASAEDIDNLIAGLEEEPEIASPTPEVASNETASTETASAEDIDNLIAGLEEDTPTIEPITDDAPTGTVVDDDDSISLDEIDSIINDITSDDEPEVQTTSDDVDTSEIDDLIAGLEDNNSDKSEESSVKIDEDFLAGIDFDEDAQSIDDVVAASEKSVEPSVDYPEHTSKNDDRPNVVDVDQINIPSQLGQVADDSEEKASQIFDALSYILDDNNELRKTAKALDTFIQSQHKMLKTLNEKFPNVKEFSDNLEAVNELIDKPKEVLSRLDNRDNELFQTMELMQFHDINRQKIERVMGVVVNLSRQLNSIFDDEEFNKSVPVSKHLPGDKSTDLVEDDDLESLIAQYNN